MAATLISTQNIDEEVKSSGGKLMQWTHAKPEIEWRAADIGAEMRKCHALFRSLAEEHPSASDEAIDFMVRGAVPEAAALKTANNTARAYATLMRRHAPAEHSDLIFHFYSLRAQVEDGTLLQEEAGRMAMQARAQVNINVHG